MIETRLEAGEMLRIFGPATIEVLEGSVSVIGAELSKGDRFIIDEFRSYVVKAEEKTLIKAELGSGARLEPTAPEEEPYDDWLRVADEVIESCLERECRIATVGPVDSGKTSMAALLANRSLRLGVEPAIVDCDIGQADLGPPGFVGLAKPSSYVSWLRRLNPEVLRFVGSIEPSASVEKHILACVELAEIASGKSNITIIDTDGWVEGVNAIEHKITLLRSLKATHTIVIGSEALARILEKSLKTRVYSVPQPLIAYTRSSTARRMLRQSNYKRFLEGARVEIIDLRDIVVNTPCLTVLPHVSRDNIQDYEYLVIDYPGGVCVYTEKPLKQQDVAKIQKKTGKREVNIVDVSNVKNTLAALRRPDGSDCPALILGIDLKRAHIRVLTKCEPPFVELLVGRVKLNDNLVEAARGRIIL